MLRKNYYSLQASLGAKGPCTPVDGAVESLGAVVHLRPLYTDGRRGMQFGFFFFRRRSREGGGWGTGLAGGLLDGRAAG